MNSNHRSVLYLPIEGVPEDDSGNNTLLVRILRRQLEVKNAQVQEAITQAELLREQNLALSKSLKEANMRASLLERKLERSKRTSSRSGINNNIDALAARLVSKKTD